MICVYYYKHQLGFHLMTLLLSYPKCPRRLQLWQKCRMWHESLRELTRIEFEIFKFGRFETVSKQPKQPKPQTIQTFFLPQVENLPSQNLHILTSTVLMTLRFRGTYEIRLKSITNTRLECESVKRGISMCIM